MTKDDKNPKQDNQIEQKNEITQKSENQEDLDNKTETDYNIKLLNHKGEEEGFFSVSEEEIDRYSILELAENNGLNIGYSCRSGACVSCSCKVVSGEDNIDIGKMEIPLIDVDEGDILTCCAGLKSTKGQKIIIQKKY